MIESDSQKLIWSSRRRAGEERGQEGKVVEKNEKKVEKKNGQPRDQGDLLVQRHEFNRGEGGEESD